MQNTYILILSTFLSFSSFSVLGAALEPLDTAIIRSACADSLSEQHARHTAPVVIGGKNYTLTIDFTCYSPKQHPENAPARVPSYDPSAYPILSRTHPSYRFPGYDCMPPQDAIHEPAEYAVDFPFNITGHISLPTLDQALSLLGDSIDLKTSDDGTFKISKFIKVTNHTGALILFDADPRRTPSDGMGSSMDISLVAS